MKASHEPRVSDETTRHTRHTRHEYDDKHDTDARPPCTSTTRARYQHHLGWAAYSVNPPSHESKVKLATY